MIKRPLDPQFATAVLTGRKTTTIRKKPWPLLTLICLYHWTGKPYRSKHQDVCTVYVSKSDPIDITHDANGAMTYYAPSALRPLHETEGFADQAAMDAWFRRVVPVGGTVRLFLNHFSLFQPCPSSSSPTKP